MSLVENESEAADYNCKQYLFNWVNQSLDLFIGGKTQLRAVDIAVLMDKREITDILQGKMLKSVRCCRTITCNLG
jgi:hypothetical protein